MAFISRLLGFGLGWALGGPIGGILGLVFGSMVDSAGSGIFVAGTEPAEWKNDNASGRLQCIAFDSVGSCDEGRWQAPAFRTGLREKLFCNSVWRFCC